MLIPPDETQLNELEASGKYIAEQKWNGDNFLINTSEMSFWNRYKERHRFQPNEQTREELKKLPKKMFLNGELMHYKTTTVKNIIVIHNILVYKDKPLIGKSWGDARKIIEDLGLPLTIFGQTSYANHLLLSRTTKEGFWKLFQQADGKIIEGIILKDPLGKLVISTFPVADVSWMLKIRKPCAKYPF